MDNLKVIKSLKLNGVVINFNLTAKVLSTGCSAQITDPLLGKIAGTA